MVFIGHVDAGKSTICGNLMYLMGVVDQRTIDKYKQEAKDKGRDSWWLAYVMDVSDEEKAKGKTVEVGRANFDTSTKKYTIFDAPGHKNYVPNMIMGAACADIGGLVISARKGEFEAGFEKDGQTREHVQLAKSLGIQKLIVIVNKMDECRWAQSRFDEIQKGLKPFFKATGYSEEDIIWIPISGISGENINEKSSNSPWYNGPTLLEILDQVNVPCGAAEGGLRIPVLDKLKDKELVVYGKVENGTIKHGDKLCIAPHGGLAQVLELRDGKGEPVMYATPGENVQIKINVADDDQIQRGFVLNHRDLMMPVTDVFEAEMDILDLLEYKPIISKGYTCMMHIHTFNDEVVIKDIIRVIERNDKGEEVTTERPKFARGQTKVIARMTVRAPIALEKFDSIEQMGRFTLRDEGKTICIGKVLRYKPYTKGAAGAAQMKQLAEKKGAAQIVTKDDSATKVIRIDSDGREIEAPKEMEAIAEEEE
jgi:peptide chain release factor subunit 3